MCLARFIASFPLLVPASYSVTSPPDDRYNCVAWAACDTTRRWWPHPSGNYYWPQSCPCKESLDTFECCFATLGYSRCPDGGLEPGFEKIAVFVNLLRPVHVARQLADGRWTSKMGRYEDIIHDTLQALGEGAYGNAGLFMKRPLGGLPANTSNPPTSSG